MMKRGVLRASVACLALLATGCHRHGMRDTEGWILLFAIVVIPIVGFIVYRND
jgi:hypothetical protein